MNLKNQIADMCKEIGYYQDSASLDDKKKNLKTISDRLGQNIQQVEIEAKKIDCLTEIEGVDLYCESGVEVLQQAKENFQTFKLLWQTLEDKSVNDDKDTLYSLTESLKNISKLFSNNHQVIWDEWLDEQKSSAQVDNFILEQQKNVHGDIKLYNDYRASKREFDAQVNGFNFDKGQLLRIQHFSQQCAVLKEKMNTDDLPDGVKTLFDKLNNVNGVALVSLLNPEVMEWLKKNNKLDTLVVRQR